MVYCFTCDECGHSDEIIRRMSESGELVSCIVCGSVMRRNYSAEAPGSSRGDQEWVMQSMAMHPDQVAEHRRLYPGIELRQTPGGFVAPIAHSLVEKRKILKQRGWIDKNAYV